MVNMAVCQEDFEIEPNRVIDLDFVTILKGEKNNASGSYAFTQSLNC